MGTAIGGDIVEVTFNHPTLGTGIILPKAGEDSTYDLGGIRVDDDDQGVDGGGNMIKKMNRKRWSFEVTCAWDMNVDQTIESLNALAASSVDANWTFENINGIVYNGKGTIVGDIQGNGNAATFTLKVSGGGKLGQF